MGLGNAQMRYHWLDLVRFIAALMVVLVHARGHLFVDYGSLPVSDKTIGIAIFYALTRLGEEAVIAFFVLSGFLVGGRSMVKMVRGEFVPSSYAVDRIVRIMLPLAPALIYTAIVRLVVDGGFDGLGLIENLFSLQGVVAPVFGGNAPLWSLSYEVWFYILTFSIGLFWSGESRYRALAIFVLVCFIFTRLDAAYLICWLIGGAAYFGISRSISRKVLLVAVPLTLYAVFSIQVARGSVSIPTVKYFAYLQSREVSIILLSVGLALIIRQLVVSEPVSAVARTIDRMGTQLAAPSYTLYLTHYPTLQLISYLGLVRQGKSISLSSVGVFLFSVFVCLAVSYILYLFFEKHTGAVRRWLKAVYLS